MKKILLVKGNPRRDGYTSRLGEKLLEGAEAAGHRTDVLSLVNLDLQVCTGCMACQTRERCIIRDDDIEQVVDAVLWADVLVLATPTHWGNMSSLMLRMFERLFGFLIKERPGRTPVPLNAKGREAVFITACSTAWPWNWLFNQSRAVMSRLKEICCYSGISATDKLVLPGTISLDDIPQKTLAKAEKMGGRL